MPVNLKLANIRFTNDSEFQNAIKGDKGDKGDTGAAGADGSDYVLTTADKTDIAGQINTQLTSDVSRLNNDIAEIRSVNASITQTSFPVSNGSKTVGTVNVTIPNGTRFDIALYDASGVYSSNTTVAVDFGANTYPVTVNPNVPYRYVATSDFTKVVFYANVSSINAGTVKTVISVYTDTTDSMESKIGWTIVKPNMISKKYIVKDNGTEQSLNTYSCTDYIDVPPFGHITIYTDMEDSAGAYFYSSEGVGIVGSGVSGTAGPKSYTVAIPDGAKYVRVSCKSSNAASFKIKYDTVISALRDVKAEITDKVDEVYEASTGTQLIFSEPTLTLTSTSRWVYKNFVFNNPSVGDTYHIAYDAVSGAKTLAPIAIEYVRNGSTVFNSGYNHLTYTVQEGDTKVTAFFYPAVGTALDTGSATFTGAKVWVERYDKNPLAHIITDGGYMRLFTKIGCIGDSLASGEHEVYLNGVKKYVDMYEHSWGQYIARMCGTTAYNFSCGGLTTKTWLSSSYATQCFDGDHLCQAYIIGLGVNDCMAPDSRHLDVGTSADIGTQADTYYRYYAEIISKIKTAQPKAKIFCVTNPMVNDSTMLNVVNYNNAIRYIASNNTNCWVVDLEKYDFIPYSSRLNSHLNAMGYLRSAWTISTYIDWIIRNNPSEFVDVGIIGTDYTTTQ